MCIRHTLAYTFTTTASSIAICYVNVELRLMSVTIHLYSSIMMIIFIENYVFTLQFSWQNLKVTRETYTCRVSPNQLQTLVVQDFYFHSEYQRIKHIIYYDRLPKYRKSFKEIVVLSKNSFKGKKASIERCVQ